MMNLSTLFTFLNTHLTNMLQDLIRIAKQYKYSDNVNEKMISSILFTLCGLLTMEDSFNIEMLMRTTTQISTSC